jgi:hypothetical protein
MSEQGKWTQGPRRVVEWTDNVGLFHAKVRAGDVEVADFVCGAHDEEAMAATRADAYLDLAAPEMYVALRHHLFARGCVGCRRDAPDVPVDVARYSRAHHLPLCSSVPVLDALAKVDGKVAP